MQHPFLHLFFTTLALGVIIQAFPITPPQVPESDLALQNLLGWGDIESPFEDIAGRAYESLSVPQIKAKITEVGKEQIKAGLEAQKHAAARDEAERKLNEAEEALKALHEPEPSVLQKGLRKIFPKISPEAEALNKAIESYKIALEKASGGYDINHAAREAAGSDLYLLKQELSRRPDNGDPDSRATYW